MNDIIKFRRNIANMPDNELICIMRDIYNANNRLTATICARSYSKLRSHAAALIKIRKDYLDAMRRNTSENDRDYLYSICVIKLQALVNLLGFAKYQVLKSPDILLELLIIMAATDGSNENIINYLFASDIRYHCYITALNVINRELMFNGQIITYINVDSEGNIDYFSN
jgi:hypothetical protein